MISNNFKEIMLKIADFFDNRKVGSSGPLGFRRSSDLKKLIPAIEHLQENKFIPLSGINFWDMGCGDGRVNILLSYISNKSVGIELDDWTLDDYAPLRENLDNELKSQNLPLPNNNIHLFEGDSLNPKLHSKIYNDTGAGIENADLFYTYLTLHEEIAELVSERAKSGAIFMVYGLEKVIPRYKKLESLTPHAPLEGIIAAYRKP